jgi:hypothetical protein
MRAVLVAATVLGVAGAARGEVLERVESPVYEAAGTPQELARKAVVCIGQVVKPGFTTAPTIVAQDIEGGRVVANNAFSYVVSIGKRTRQLRGRSTLTFEGKNGRFRIVHTDVQGFIGMAPKSWEPIETPPVGMGNTAESDLQAISARVAACVQATPGRW